MGELHAFAWGIVGDLARQSGDHRYRCGRDLKAAIDVAIRRDIRRRLAEDPQLTWKTIGEELGVSAQAAHRKYGHLRANADNPERDGES
jgi:hypothetical protein